MDSGEIAPIRSGCQGSIPSPITQTTMPRPVAPASQAGRILVPSKPQFALYARLVAKGMGAPGGGGGAAGGGGGGGGCGGVKGGGDTRAASP